MKIADYLKEGVGLLQHPREFLLAGLIAALMSVTFILTGPAIAGMMYMALKCRRGERPEIGDVFKGFDYYRHAIPVSLAILVPLIVASWVSLLLRHVPLFGFYLGSLVVLSTFTVALTLTLYAMPLVVDKGLGWRPAILASVARVRKEPLGHLVFGLLVTVIVSFPVLGLPICVGAILAAYSDAGPDLLAPAVH